MEYPVYKITGQDSGRKVELSDSIFGIEPNDHAIYLDVKQYMANQRQGTHKSKERAEIIGSTRKIKKQKGTGTARAGSIKSPLFRGGGRVFGPRPRDYAFKLNKKLKKLARMSALSYKAKKNELIIVEDFNFDQPKTSQFVALKENLKINDKSSLFILSSQNKNVYLSARNLEKTSVLTVSEINTYEILKAKNVLLSESSIEVLEKLF